MPYFRILFVFKEQFHHLFKVLYLQFLPTFFYMEFFLFTDATFFSMFLILLISL